ncbi:MAG TPA: DUF72 domain-containing protein [Chryseolinea sp.]|nr:DUF72 domain-containing protein [Chryseolinea sp.]
MKKGKIYIGTSGWHYKHWRGRFYPVSLRPEEQLDYYLMFFDTVEINNSFYRLPTRETFLKWHSDTPMEFLFSVKASRFITHMKKLKEPEDPLDLLMSRADALEDKLGTILFQLPPGWMINLERFDYFLSALPRSERCVFEFRNSTWYTTDIYDMLRRHNCAFCIYELAGHTSPLIVTADFVYVRLHGPGGKYQGSYKNNTLKEWALQVLQWKEEGKDVFIYFDNDQEAFAVFNALTLKDMVSAA